MGCGYDWVCDLVLGGVYGGEVLIFEVMDGGGSDFVCLFFFFFFGMMSCDL